MGARAKLMLLACLGALALAPASASASIAYMNEDGIATAQGEPGESNDMSIRSGEDGVILGDSAGIRPRDELGCRALSATEVTCFGEGGWLLGEDGNDTLRDTGLAGPAGFGVLGGPGSDSIAAGTAVALIYGDAREVLPSDGDDTIVGSSGNRPKENSHDFDDEINGGGGNDTIDGREGDDNVSGQAGNDSVAGGDGRDNVEATTLLTPDGNDAPADAGNDNLSGGAGDDVIRAILGSDTADGGAGDDFLIGTDTDLARDDGNSDGLACGAGTDRVAAGEKDKVAVGCETLQVRLYCTGGKTCTAKGGVTGKAKGAKKVTTVAKISKTIQTGENANFSLAKATKLLGSSSKVTLTVSVVMRRGKSVVGGVGFRFSYVK